MTSPHRPANAVQHWLGRLNFRNAATVGFADQSNAYFTKLLSRDCAIVLVHIIERLLLRLNLRIGSTSVASAKSTCDFSFFVESSKRIVCTTDPF